MLAKLSFFIQFLQKKIYKPSSFSHKILTINGKKQVCVSVFLIPENNVIDLTDSLIQKHKIRFIAKSPCKKYYEFFTVKDIEQVKGK